MKACIKNIFSATLFACASIAAISVQQANAAEDAKGFFLLGSNASLGGFMPPPGTTVVDWKYYYTGDASGRAAEGVVLDALGNLSVEANVDVDANIFIDILAPNWVAPGKVLGGSFGLGVLIPVGSQDISADIDALATLTLPDGRTFSRGAQFEVDDSTFSFGDPVLLTQLGWSRGAWAWRIAGLLNIPIGAYGAENLANMGFNRWGFDAHGAVTWLDPSIGFEVSTITGFTFNGENPDTDYRTGTEFHVEWALMQHFSKQFSAGLVGYHYQQVTGDSGAGATLGPFKGRVTSLGPSLNYNTQICSIPVSTSLRWYHEFDAKNRLEGDAVYFQTTVPFGVLRK